MWFYILIPANDVWWHFNDSTEPLLSLQYDCNFVIIMIVISPMRGWESHKRMARKFVSLMSLVFIAKCDGLDLTGTSGYKWE